MAKKKEAVEVEVKAVTPETPKKKVNKKKLFTLVGVGALAIGVIATTYWAVIEYALKDYENMGYMTFQYSVSDSDANHVSEVTITGINAEKNYPSNFRVPSKLLGYNVTGIGDYAFAGLERLKSVSLPNTITSIGTGAFSNCENLTTVNLESRNITYVGDYIFEDSPKWEGNNQTGMVMLSSILYRYNGDMPSGTVIKPIEDRVLGEDGNNTLYINSDVTYIASGAFAEQDGLTSVKLPERFSDISSALVRNCINLESFVADGITSVGSEAFLGCSKLEEFDLKDITSLGANAFNGTGLKVANLNDSLTYIDDGMFKDCASLTDVDLPNNIERIGNEAFMNCESLTSIESGTIGGAAFTNNLDSVTYIGNSAFENSGLVSFTVPKNLVSINASTFKDCSDLASVTLPEVAALTGENEIDVFGRSAYSGLQTIEAQAFMNTPSLKTFIIPFFRGDYIERFTDGSQATRQNVLVNTLYTIGESAFENSGLTSITLPASLNEVTRYCFRNCVDLAEVIFQDPTNSVTVGTYDGGFVGDVARTSDIRASAFENTTSLDTIALPNSLIAIQSAVFKNSGIGSITLSTNRGFDTLSESLFSGCKNLTQISIPSNVNTIKANCFEYSGLASITIDEQISKMEARVFFGCEDLTVINLNFSQATYDGFLALGSRGWYSTWDVIDEEGHTFDNVVFLQ